jgi:dGTPase
MDWEQLLCKKRILGESKESKKKIDPRSEFEKDVQRIFFSHPFRRLQNKTQLIPIPVFDFIHTRLTHSLEVASVGNTIGRTVGREILLRNRKLRTFCKTEKITEHDFGSIVQAACLAHDIGNPPFGHSGEDSISD